MMSGQVVLWFMAERLTVDVANRPSSGMKGAEVLFKNKAIKHLQ